MISPETGIPHDIAVLPLEAQVSRRQALLDAFGTSPGDAALWETAYAWVGAEGDADSHSGGIASIPAEELISMALAVQDTPPQDRYDLMANYASNGQRWFDLLETFSSTQLRTVERDIISSWVSQTDPPTPFHRALDLGTGTGKSLGLLEVNAGEVVGVDRNPLLLEIAKGIAGEHTSLVLAEVDRLPFVDRSFDIVTSAGLTGALDKITATGYYRELARVLVLNGIYIEGSYWTAEDGFTGEELASVTRSSKAMLADMIVDTVSGKHQLYDQLGIEERQQLFEGLGLQVQYHDILSNDHITHNLITIITKVVEEGSGIDPMSKETALAM